MIRHNCGNTDNSQDNFRQKMLFKVHHQWPKDNTCKYIERNLIDTYIYLHQITSFIHSQKYLRTSIYNRNRNRKPEVSLNLLKILFVVRIQIGLSSQFQGKKIALVKVLKVQKNCFILTAFISFLNLFSLLEILPRDAQNQTMNLLTYSHTQLPIKSPPYCRFPFMNFLM